MSTAPPPSPPPQLLAFQLLGGAANAEVLHSLVVTGVLEALAAGPRTAGELASACSLHEGVLDRTLRHAAGLGLVVREEGRVALTELGRLFARDTPGSLALSAEFLGAPPWRDSWNDFEHCLRTGEAAFDHVHGRPFFDFLEANERYGQPFNDHMTRLTRAGAAGLAGAFDFARFETICDVGGGQGLLLAEILARAPRARGILYDLPGATKELALGEAAGRVTVTNGSFFDAVPAADCIVLKTIVHDWGDAKATRILERCREAVRPGGAVLVMDQVVGDPPAPFQTFYDLHMQVMLGGKERTEAEHRALLAAAGLRLVRIHPVPGPLQILEAAP